MDVLPPDREHHYVNRGRTAFEAIIRSEDLGGKTILLPAFLCSGSFKPLLDEYDIDPIFVDVDPETYHVDFETARTFPDVAAAVVVHTFGLPVDIERWQSFCSENDITLVEDCARALGARTASGPVGTVGDYAIFSLQKVSPAMQGGLLVGSIGDEVPPLEPPEYGVESAYALLPRRLRRVVQRALDLTSGRDDDVRSSQEGYNPYEDDNHGTRVTPRGLDRCNRYTFERSIQTGFRDRLRAYEDVARALRSRLSETELRWQSHDEGRVYHTIPARITGSRDRLRSVLRRNGHVVNDHWRYPLVAYYEREYESSFPVTARLASEVIHFPAEPLRRGSVGSIVADVRACLRRS